MKLREARVQSFRSIVDSGFVPCEEVATVLIGKNEQGKTNFLRGLESFNGTKKYRQQDLPNHLRAELDEKDPASIPIVTVRLVPQPEERELLRNLMPELGEVPAFEVIRYFDGQFEYRRVKDDGGTEEIKFPSPEVGPLVEELRTRATTLKDRLTENGNRHQPYQPTIPQAHSHIDQFVGANFTNPAEFDNLLKTLSSALRGLPNSDKPIVKEIDAAVTEFAAILKRIGNTVREEARNQFRKCLPYFILHSTDLDRIPDWINIAQFVADPEGHSRGMARLCEAAGLSFQKIQQLAKAEDAADREAFEDHYRSSISGGINEFWTQDQYTVHFRIDTDRLSVSVSDSQYSQRIPPTERSDGFQWYLSFYTALLSDRGETTTTVILLDNPGLELHPDGQRDIKRYLEEKLPDDIQVIYVTHSPAMIDAFNLAQLRTVNRVGSKGTRIERWIPPTAGQGDLLEPIRMAIGSRIIDGLAFSRLNILVEGAADKPILEGALAICEGGDARDFCVNGSVAETRSFLPEFFERAGLKYVVYLDDDSSGRKIAEELKQANIPDARVAPLRSLLGDAPATDRDLEDLLSIDFYHRAVCETYPERFCDPPKSKDGKITKHYEKMFKEEFKLGFSKARVAETVKKLLLSGHADGSTKQLLQKVVASLRERMTSPPRPRS